MATAERPVGVAVLSVLHVLLGILLLLGGFALMIVGFVVPEVLPHFRFPIRMTVIAVALLAFALIDFVLAYALWIGRRWAWVVSLIFAVVGIIFSVFSLFLRPGIGETVSLVTDLVIVYYLMQPRVGAYFGRGRALAGSRSGLTVWTF